MLEERRAGEVRIARPLSAKKKGSGGGKAGKKAGPPPIAVNRKARFDYEILDTFEAGVVLRGTEVKSLRSGKISLEESFARLRGTAVFLFNCHIPEYTPASWANHDPVRKRKLLLHRREIQRIEAHLAQQGLTLIPTRMYWSSRGHAKVELGVARGRKKQDKRQELRKRDDKRLMTGY